MSDSPRLPFRFGRTGEDQMMILDADGKYVASIQIWQTPRHMGLYDEERRKAGAALIVRNVNAVPALVKALEKIANDDYTHADESVVWDSPTMIWQSVARAALAAYKKEA